MPPIKPFYLFSTIAGLGFVAQWILMMLNGSLFAMILASWKSTFPDGAPLKSWTGLWPIDLPLGILVVFFGGLLDSTDLLNHEPFLLLADLIFSLAVCGTMTLVEDRRNRKTGPLRYPAFWQIMWNFFGAASIMPTFSRHYVTNRSTNSPSLPRDQAQALPFTALWTLVLSVTLFAPALLGAEPFRIQDSVIAWFLAPLAVGPFQDLVGTLISRSGSLYKGFASPVSVAYSIVGAVSAIIHISVLTRVFQNADLSWSRVYWPSPSAVQPGPTLIHESALLFIQFGHLSVSLSILAIGFYTIVLKNSAVSRPSTERSSTSITALKLLAVEGLLGPGAALAWIMSTREQHSDDTLTKKK
ncbi:uncharacterized protein GGS22DRAFT_185170 [Annulohypoxylon maeteangense]|uniref:uncharacterized protein n=1 Tax=Annulohypoxylon maeteangense TaxID=1927788 RepID=UPI0020077B92|nr:uncharacterized protein GGS22DRAFT_185170 [Annulohypoxylon maeteangense]KAI0887791.1 hypothetical protein GGS22DRAFT_185170 [Annulohypoxylon maeteangense]